VGIDFLLGMGFLVVCFAFISGTHLINKLKERKDDKHKTK